jgi:hypothetical protein
MTGNLKTPEEKFLIWSYDFICINSQIVLRRVEVLAAFEHVIENSESKLQAIGKFLRNTHLLVLSNLVQLLKKRLNKSCLLTNISDVSPKLAGWKKLSLSSVHWHVSRAAEGKQDTVLIEYDIILVTIGITVIGPNINYIQMYYFY